jgi:cell division protease FtsH
MKDALMEYETIDALQVDDLMNRTKVRPPADFDAVSSDDSSDNNTDSSKPSAKAEDEKKESSESSSSNDTSDIPAK